ncbi:MAG: DUF4474 domain-containing protein [Oscillospiraceae bacterium]|nr:DUF4474 domain-containing protein [Oscillospiraceae bacterium]
MKRHALTRVLCTVLCAAMLLGVSAPSLSVSAAPASATAQQANSGPGILRTMVDFFFRNFGFLGFIFDPYQFTIINQKPVFQWGLGFNEVYDVFPWVVNVWADTIRCKFNYEGRDWLIQLWKGGYGLFLATGGEIGIYTKSERFIIEHYNAPVSQNDWLNLEYTIYNKGEKLFTRPSPYLTGDEGPYWWAPGYKVLSICTDFLSSPRKNVIMDATIEFKDKKMAQLFIDQLKEKGFKPLAKGATMSIKTPETYLLMPNGKSVRLVWQNLNEGWF